MIDETFKKIIFTRRIIAYHQSFVPIGENNHTKPIFCIWHEGTPRLKISSVRSVY